MSDNELTDAEILDMKIDAYLERGWRVESRGGSTAVVTKGGFKVIGHAIFAMVLLGLGVAPVGEDGLGGVLILAIIWIALWIWIGKPSRETLRVRDTASHK